MTDQATEIHLDRVDWPSAVRRSIEPDLSGVAPDTVERFARQCAKVIGEQFAAVEGGAWRPLSLLTPTLIAYLNHEVDVHFRHCTTIYDRSRLKHNLAGMIHGAAAVYASAHS